MTSQMGHTMKQGEHPEMFDTNQLYRWSGTEFFPIEYNDVPKLPVTTEAIDAVKNVRKAVQKIMPTRPDLAIVASAMLLAAASQQDIAELVKKYGARVYAM